VSDPALADLESDTGETAASSVTDEAIADPDAAPDSFASDDAVSFSDDVVSSDALDAVVSNVPAAMQYGDLAALGLTGWTPAGLVRWGLEALHVSTGLPWFHTIVVASILARLAVAPLNVMSTRDSARIAPFQPRLTAIAQELRAASVKRDPHAIRRAQEAQRAVFKAADVNPVRLTLVGLSGFLFQLPLSFGIFFGLKKLCELPLEGLKHSGFALVPDLTVVDPTYMLPLTAAALISFQTKVGLERAFSA
jgi:YidC/Oxa1 family membrane protein insertase